MKTKHIVMATALVSLVLGTGCMGNIRAGTAKRLSRKELEGPECKPKDIKTELVRVIDDKPDGLDYLAEVHAEGCGKSENFLCAQAGPDWKCERIEKK
ncbi:MAG: hypothetical protein ACXWUG_26100 [Polyangiales bacterium]